MKGVVVLQPLATMQALPEVLSVSIFGVIISSSRKVSSYMKRV